MHREILWTEGRRWSDVVNAGVSWRERGIAYIRRVRANFEER